MLQNTLDKLNNLQQTKMESKKLLYIGVIIVVMVIFLKILTPLFYLGLLCIVAYGIYVAFNRGKEMIKEKRNTRNIKVK